MKLKLEWEQIINSKSVRPYLFRTRLERTLLKTIRYAKEIHNPELERCCKTTQEKMDYITDKSNNTSDGTLRSYIVLKDDLINIYETVS